MAVGKFFPNMWQILSSRTIRKGLLKAFSIYLIGVGFAAIAIFKNGNLIEISKSIVLLVLIPLLLISGMVFFHLLKFNSSSKTELIIDGKQIYLRNSSSRRNIDHVFILYRPGAFIEISSTNNVFKSDFIYGPLSYLEKIVFELEQNGFIVEKFKG